MSLISSFPGRKIISGDSEYLYFGGTAYLGLATLPAFQDIFIKNMRKYGTGYAASRKANIRIDIYEQAENILADLIGCQKALSVSSGFLAGQLALQAFRGEEYAFFCTSDTHPALYHPAASTAGTATQLLEEVRTFTSAYPEKKAVVLCDSITITENLYENNWYEQLPWSRTVFIADDSHGLGVMGPNGTGIYRKLKSIPFSELVVCGSLSKGFAVQAGAVFSSAGVIARLWDHPFFAGASPASPAAMATFRDAIPLYEIQRKKLTDHIRTFDNTFSSGDMFRHINGHPSYAYTQESLTRYLLDKGILTTAFHYPDVASPMVRRIVLSASHTEEDLAYLSACLKNFLRS